MHNQSTGPSQAPAIASFEAATWRKSSRSQAEGEDCVELTAVPDIIAVRDSKDPHGPKIILAPAMARSLAAQIKRGQHDI